MEEVELVQRDEFVAAALDLEDKIFMNHVLYSAISGKDSLSRNTGIASLKVDKFLELLSQNFQNLQIFFFWNS